LGRRGIVGEAGGVGRAALGEHLPLELLHLPFEPFEALVGARRLALRKRRRRNERRRGAGQEGRKTQ
jgi:hypothetical protein